MSTAAPAAQPARPTGGYAVARPQGRCMVSGRTIEPGEAMMAALRETAEGLERVDVSTEAWAGFDRAGVLAFWQTHMPYPQAKKKIFVDDDVLCDLFERLADAAEPAKLNFRFVLGLILMRKRRLNYESTRQSDGGREVWSVKLRGRDALLDLVNPKLGEEQVAEVSTQLQQILNEDA